MDLFKIKSRTRSPTRASGNNESLRRKGDSAGEAVVRLDAAALIGAQQQQQQPLQREVSRSTNVNADGNGSAPVNLLDEKQMGGQGVQLVEFSFPSLLSPPNPAFSTSEARGILINARRASSKERSELGRTDQAVLADKTNTTAASASSAAAGKASGLSQSRPHLRGSASADSISQSRTNSNQPQGQDSTAEAPRIRFAPLPDPRRPRRYSTGRDIWLDDDPDNVHINTRDGPDVDTEGWSDGAGPSGSPPMNIPGSIHSTDGETSSPVSPFGSSFGSIGHKRGTSTSSSITSKLLNPLKLGKSKSKDLNRTSSIESTSNSISPSSASYASVSQWLTGGEPLGRRISTGTVGDMPASERQRIDDLRPTGAPLSKSLSTDAADSVPRPRKAYPSVAQGGNRRRAPRYAKKAEEPEFVEWSHSSGLIGAAAEEDDGSGVAWLKKRREERARKAKEDAEAAAKTDASGESSSTKPAEADVQKDKSTDHGIAAVPALQVEPSTPVVERFDHRSSQDELQLEEEEEENQEQSAAASQSHKPASVATVSTAEGEDGEEGDSDEEDDGNARSDDEDGEDLTAEELEEEERLAEEARRTTEGAGREVFHSHEHVAATYQVDTGSQRKGTSDGTPAPSTEVSRRGSPLPSRNPSRQASLATTS